jgi:hypothetical protein
MDKEFFASYKERFKMFLDVTHPKWMIKPTAEVAMAKAALAKASLTIEERKGYQATVDCCMNSCGEVIPHLFRVGAIAPMNIPLVFFMLITPASATGITLGLHWANQTYNSACNYYNRSGDALSSEEIAKSYGLAVTSACTLAFGLGKIMNKGPAVLRSSPWFIPLLASGSAGLSNIAFMRMNEVTDGTQVTDDEGTTRGYSKVAGLDNIVKSGFSRCVLVPISVLLAPSVSMSILKSFKSFPKNKKVEMLIQIGLVYGCLAVTLPAALAVYPPKSEFDVEVLEPEFRDLKDSKGQRVTRLYSNKGL